MGEEYDFPISARGKAGVPPILTATCVCGQEGLAAFPVASFRSCCVDYAPTCYDSFLIFIATCCLGSAFCAMMAASWGCGSGRVSIMGIESPGLVLREQNRTFT
jgi:hypothetical protein